MPEVVPLISANILLNSVVMGDPHAQSILRDRYEALPYTWGTALGSDSQSAVAVKKAPGRYFDTILASDVVYYPEGYQPLLSTLRDLLGAPSPSSDANSTNTAARGEGGDGGGGARSGGPVCILAHRHRHPEDKKFFDALYATETLAVERLDFHVQQQVQVRGDTTQQGKDVQALKDVILFRITMR